MHQCILAFLLNPDKLLTVKEQGLMKLLSEACEYGLRAVVWMAQCPGEPQKVKGIAEEIKAAPGYLVKVLQALTKAGILSARRGSNGGFTLKSDPSELTALDIINAIDPLERITTCPLDLDSHATSLCPIHRGIDDAMGMIEDGFGQLTIREVIADASTLNPVCKVLVPHAGLHTIPSPSDARTPDVPKA
jgi:Rrf2 family nitric oxide-sensitive transcriptional repressor